MGLIRGRRHLLPHLLMVLLALPFVTYAQAFVDCYTTWCGPCRMMATQIFPQPEVGEFMNDKFVSVSVQLDTTSRDNDYAYPTFLILSPDGKPLDRIVGGHKTTAPFVAAMRETLDPGRQYYTRLREFHDGNRNPAFLRRLALQAHQVYDQESGREVMKALIDASGDIFTNDPLEVVLKYTERSSDSTFAFVIANTARIDTVMGVGVAEQHIARTLPKAPFFMDMLAKMQKGEKTWN